jgi:Domain of unknown function (DUF4173)
MAPRRSFLSSLTFKYALAIVVIAIGDWLFWQHKAFGSGLGVFAAVLSLAALAGRPAILRDRLALAAWVVSLVFAGGLILDPSLIAWLLFGGSLDMAILKLRTGRFDDAWKWFQRLAWQTATSAVLPLLDLVRITGVNGKMRIKGRRTQRFSARTATATLALPLIGTAIFLLLFADANPVIRSWFEGQVSVDDLSILRIFLWGILLLFAWNALRPRLARYLIPSFDGTGDVRIPGVSVASVTISLIMFNALFAVQNGMDMAWLWGLVPLPADMNLAEYAHRGAYPLIATALLAGLFVLVTLRPGSQTAAAPRIRWLVIAWVAQNILLVASSALRTIDYVGAYSLTLLRIAALEWMALVALGLGFILWRVLASKSGPWLINANTGALVLLLSVAAFVDHGEIVARWNTTHAREVGGEGVHLDLCYMRSLGASALLPLVELEANPRLAPEFRQRVVATRIDLRRRIRLDERGGYWTLRSRNRATRADAIVGLRPMQRLTAGERDCFGRLLPPPPPLPTTPSSPAIAKPPAPLTETTGR